MILDLTKEDIDAILYALGNLPTNTGVYPLGLKIKQQLADQDQEKPYDS